MLIYWKIILITFGVVAFVLGLYLGRRYFQGGVCTIRKRLDGQTVFITGANTGLGRITAIELAKRGAKIIIACRDQKKGQDVAKEIQDLGLERPTVYRLDLADLSSVDACVKQIEEAKVTKIDILINNAGIMAPQKRDLTKQGFEIQLGVNHIGHFHLTNQLIPLLQNTPKSRVINVSSLAHEYGQINLADINYDNNALDPKWGSYFTYKAYSASKLMNILHAQELNNRYEQGIDNNFKAVSLHPGVVRTELSRNQLSTCWARTLYILFYPFVYYGLKSPFQGAQTTLYCALEDYDKLKGGKYYSDCAEGRTTARLQEAGNNWQLTEELISSRYKASKIQE